jgi:VIT1/CCC1 family predicted Fe2+/Mn2+ transporter
MLREDTSSHIPLSTATSSTSLLPPSSTPDADASGDTIECAVKKYRWTPPNGAAVPYRPHAGEGSQYLRDFILGVNDGIISTFLLVVAVVGGTATTLQALLSAVSAAVAGAIAMGIGEYIATKSQLQVNDGEMRLESEHFKYHRDVELLQLRQFLQSVSLSGPLLEAVVAEVGRSDESLMKMMMAFEFGVHAEELERNPWKAMFMSGRLFLIGSLPTIAPFCATTLSPHIALAIAAGLVGTSLFVVGAYKTRTTKGNWLIDGLENLGLGAIATGVSYAVGVAFSHASGGNVA